MMRKKNVYIRNPKFLVRHSFIFFCPQGIMFNCKGISVTTAGNGAEALATLQNRDFDCVLMDIQMPVMDGYSASYEIRKHPQWEGLPIIALTANVMEGDREKALAAGMNAFIGKPLNEEEMLTTMARCIALKPAGSEQSPSLDEI